MKPSHIILMFLLGALLFAEQTHSAPPKKPSEDMILILIHHKSGPNDLDTKGLVEDKAMKIPQGKELAEFELYDVPYPKGVADYFGYNVYLHRKTGQYWINIIGGVAGVNQFFGPGKVDSLRK